MSNLWDFVLASIVFKGNLNRRWKLIICIRNFFRLVFPKIYPLTPNDPYRGRTATLISKVAFSIFIQRIYVLNILNVVYTMLFFLFKMQFVS